MSELERLTSKLKGHYGEYLTQAEFTEAAGICAKTAYKATKSGCVPYKKICEGRLHYYRIKAEDAARYILERASQKESGTSPESIRSIETLLSSEPDVLSIKETCLITGMCKTYITNLVLSGSLNAFRWKGDYRIPKAELVRYMASSRYTNSKSRSLQHQTVNAVMEWLQLQRSRYNIKREDNTYGNNK